MTVVDDAPRTMPKHNLGGDYPTKWDAYVGQPRPKEQLMYLSAAARMLNLPMAHVLIVSGTPGAGKTALAVCAAVESGAGQIRVAGNSLTAAQARLLISSMEDGDILFIDEIHTLVAGGKSKIEWMLNYLSDGVIMGPRGAEVMPKVTIIAATTDKGRLPETLLNGRFKIVELDAYTTEEAMQIAEGQAERMIPHPLPLPTKDNLRAIADAAVNNPRQMAVILEHLRNITMVSKGANWTGTEYDLTKALDWAGVTPDGLTVTARRFLLCLLDEFAGEPAGQAKIQDVLREPGGLGYTERLLVEKELITFTKSGRMLTQAGIKRARRLQLGD